MLTTIEGQDRRDASGALQRARSLCVVGFCVVAVGSVACRGDLLGVPIPPNAIPNTQVQDSAGGEAIRAGAIGLFAFALASGGGMMGDGGLMADEFYQGSNFNQTIAADTRSIHPGDATLMDRNYVDLQHARVQSLQAITVLEHNASVAGSADVGEMFAIAGYVEVLLAEQMCSGIPVTKVALDGSVSDNSPLTTDSVLSNAIALFDSAQQHAGGSAEIANLAAVGRARGLLDLGRPSGASASVAAVPPTFVYTIEIANTGQLGADIYSCWLLEGGGCGWNMADRKGTNGLPYVSAHDARLPTVAMGMSATGTPEFVPTKFASTASQNGPLPLADGVEAGLIAAEAALAAHDVTGWLADLNALRANFVALRGPYPADTSYHQLAPLADPGSDSARVTLTFYERGFWLYGTAHRLGDLRRLVRQYGRDQAQVFPIGAYVNGTASQLRPTYGTDVNFPIGVVEQGNPQFHGCLSLGA